MRNTIVIFVSLVLVGACQKKRDISDALIVDDAAVLYEAELDAGSSSTTAGPCPADMKPVAGDSCSQAEQTCAEWADEDKSPTANSGIGPLRCTRFSESKCTSKQRKHLSFCMDVYEWPNKKGELPPVGMTWRDAKSSCEAVGKRLCTAQEWTFACEGPDVKPYPYGDGMHRDDTACNIDKPSMPPDRPRSEWPEHYRAVPSGSMERCVSWAGVHDMTGNVDEFVFNPSGSYTKAPYVSGLKGGYWGPVRTRCRPMTDVHGPDFDFYQIGFRCCRDVG